MFIFCFGKQDTAWPSTLGKKQESSAVTHRGLKTKGLLSPGSISIHGISHVNNLLQSKERLQRFVAQFKSA